MAKTEQFHLVDVATGKYIRADNGKPRVMAKSTFLKDRDEYTAKGWRLGKQVGDSGEVAPEEGEATGDNT